MTSIAKKFQDSINAYTWVGVGETNDPDYQEMVDVHTADRVQLNQVLTLFKNKKYKEAYKKAWGLDTIVRDQIPKAVWTILYKYEE